MRKFTSQPDPAPPEPVDEVAEPAIINVCMALDDIVPSTAHQNQAHAMGRSAILMKEMARDRISEARNMIKEMLVDARNANLSDPNVPKFALLIAALS
jgi:hypothetical protein